MQVANEEKERIKAPPNFLESPQVLKALDMMRKEKVDIQKLELSVEEIAELRELGINIVNVEGTQLYFIDTNSQDNMYEVRSFRNGRKKNVKWVEVGALFAGHKAFDKKAFMSLMELARSRGYTEVHFSGDLCAGPPPKGSRKNRSDWSFWEETTNYQQADMIVEMLKQFPEMTFYAINGENEVAFERLGHINPLVIIQRDLRMAGVNFIYKPTMTLNIVVEGLVQRIVYLKRKRTYTVSYQSEFYMDEQYTKMVNNVVIRGQNYKLMSVQFGGAMENSLNKNGSSDSPIYMTTNSGFVRDNFGEFSGSTTYPSIRFCEVWIQHARLTQNLKTSLCFEI